MGSVSLVCPMCCGETFDNSQSLKYHLLSMTDNLYCPNCSERSDSVAALIQHLDCCGDSMDVANGLSEIDETEVSVDTKGDGTNHNYLATVNEDGMVVVGHLPAMNDPNEHIIDKMDIDDNTEDNDDILEHLDEIGDIDIPKNEVEEDIEEVKLREKRIKDENSSSETIDNETELIEGENNREISNFGEIDPLEETADEEVAEEEQNETELVQVESEALYSCSSCSMSFNSVLSHIKEYHDGQEVVLEMAEQQMEDLPEESNDFEAMVDENQSTNSSRATKESSSIGERASVGTGTSGGVGLPRQRQTMNTLRTEECVDSEGRLYTRKVVQIERFWDRGSSAATGAQSQLQQQQHQQATKSSPMIEKFFSNAEGLKIRAKSPGIPVTNSPIVVTSTTTTTTMTNTTTNAVENCNDTSARHQLRMYRCNKCLEQFVKLAEFRVHACIHGNNRCELCDQAFASVKALQLHSRIHEVETEGGNDNNFVCQTCGTEFTSHKSLRLHSRMHAPVRARHVDAPEGTSNEIFTCIECGKTLSESYRKAHMALHKGDSVTCTVCNRKFDSAESLAMHAAVHLEFGNSQNHKFHQTTEDRKDDESNKDGLKSGKGKKNDKSGGGDAQEKPYQCQHCGRRFTRPHEKVKHERIHTGEKPHACEVCGKTFRVSYCLTLHMRTHTGVRPYACQHCGKRFKASSVYNHHLLTHGEERAYTCPYCPKTFKTRVQLAGHKNSHTKPFRCTECSRPFASLYAARAHIQTHKKDNNLKFSCYICGASYGRAFALKDHLKQHTGQDVLATPEASREEEVADADDFLINEETEEYEEIEEIEENEEVEEEEIKLVAVAAAAAAGNANVEIHKLNLIDSHEQTQ